MGKRGPLKTPKIVGKGCNRPRQSQADAGLESLADMPAGLTSGAKRRWKTLAPILLADGRLRADTRESLLTYCRLADEADLLGGQLDAEGVVVMTPHGRIPNPLAKILQGVRSTMLRYGAALGLDPCSKARLESSGSLKAEPDMDDPVERFLADYA